MTKQEAQEAQEEMAELSSKSAICAQLLQYLEQDGGTMPPEAREVYIGYLAAVLQDAATR